MWQSVLNAYHSRVVEPGRQPLFLLLLGLIAAFLFIRLSTRLIRRGTPGGPATSPPAACTSTTWSSGRR